MEFADPPSLSSGTQPPAGRRRRGRAGPNSAATRSGVGRGPCHRQALGAGGTRPWGSSPRPPQAGTTASSPLGAAAAAQTRPLNPDYLPQQWQLLHALWTLEAVAELIRQQCGQELSRQAVGNYLRAWGRSLQKPALGAREQSPEAMPPWLEHQYPALRCQGEGTPFTLGDTWAWVGSTSPEPPGSLRAGPGGDQTTGQRFSCHLISTLTNRGSLRFQVFASRAATCFWSFCAPWCARARAKSFSWLTLNPCMEGTASRSGTGTGSTWNCSIYRLMSRAPPRGVLPPGDLGPC